MKQAMSRQQAMSSNQGSNKQKTSNKPPCPPLEISPHSAQRSPPWGGGGDCKGISRPHNSGQHMCTMSGWYHTWSPRENILGLKKGHDTLYTAFGERTHR